MLVVGPGSCTLPMFVSVLVSTTWTVFVPESNARSFARVGDRIIMPGELPAFNSAALAYVSLAALRINKPARAVGDETDCETSTRVVRPLPVFLPPGL